MSLFHHHPAPHISSMSKGIIRKSPGRPRMTLSTVSTTTTRTPQRRLQPITPFTPRRFTSTASPEATTILTNLLSKRHTPPPTLRTQTLSGPQLLRLSLTLSRPHLYTDLPLHNPASNHHDATIPTGTPLPPGYHHAFFTPALLPHDIGPDGADVSFNPPPPFTRRMWAGGTITWEKDNLLRVGDEVREETQLVSAEAKRLRKRDGDGGGKGEGEEMLVVGVEKRFLNARGLCLTDKRDWIFRLPLPGGQKREYVEQNTNGAEGGEVELPEPGAGVQARDFLQTPVSLFRFSALTFNAHMVHYSREWCREVEGHRDLVVHGPLNLVNMLDFWRDEHDGGGGYAVPENIRYRATAPFYVNERYRGLLERREGKASVRLWGSDGKGDVRVGMMGDIEEWAG